MTWKAIREELKRSHPNFKELGKSSIVVDDEYTVRTMVFEVVHDPIPGSGIMHEVRFEVFSNESKTGGIVRTWFE